MRILLETSRKLREIVPENLPLLVRISATDWTENGWDLEQAIVLCQELKIIGVDLIDVSSGGNILDAKIPVAPNYQVSFAAEIRKRVGIATGAVGLITEAKQAEEILQKGEADAILMAREFLRDPYFPFKAAKELGEILDYVPKQYGRAIDLRMGKSA